MMMDVQFVHVNNNKSPNRRNPNNKRRGGGGKKKGGKGCGRLWQLPESSVDEYMKWIQEKPEKDQTSSEQRISWKYMIRRLDVIKKDGSDGNGNGNGNGNGRGRRQERIREFVERLQAKPPHERSTQEEHFIRLFHRRKKDRKAQRKQQKKEQQDQQQHQPNDGPIVSWMRVNNENNNNENNNNNNNNNIGDSNSDVNYNFNNNNNNNKSNKGLEPMASLASLRESMMKLGLSSDKLKQVRFAE